MSRKVGWGLTSITVGDIAGDGGMGTVLTELFGSTVLGSATLSSTEPSREDIKVEELSDPIGSITTDEGTLELRFSTYNIEPLVLEALFGGTVTGVGDAAVWTAPSSQPEVEMSVEVRTKSGITIQIPRMKLVAQMELSFDKGRYGQINIIGTVLAPTKVGEAKMKIGPTSVINA